MFSIRYKHLILALPLAMGAMALQVPALADTLGGMNPVSSQKLDQIRGGFSVQYDLGQMKLALDVNRVSFINGNLAPMEQFTGASGGTLDVIQSGLNNSVSASVVDGIPMGTLGTLIQNSLNNQVIRTVNVMNMTVTSQAFAQAMSLQATTQAALLRFMH